jgi:Tfp pilus assembly protein PilF
VILGIFLALLYVRFRAEYDANAVTVIKIQPVVATTADETASFPASDDAAPMVSATTDSEAQRASMLVEQKKWREAEQIYLKELARKPGARVLNDLGVLYLKKGDTGLALGYFNRAMAADPADTSALFNRALALSRSGQTSRALESYRELLARQPAHFEAQYNLGILLNNRGDHASGATELEKAVQLAGGSRKAHALYTLGMTRRKLGQTDLAAKALDAAIRIAPGDPEPRVALAALEPDTRSRPVRWRSTARYWSWRRTIRRRWSIWLRS